MRFKCLDEVQIFQGYRATSNINLLFTTKSAELPGTNFWNDPCRMKG